MGFTNLGLFFRFQEYLRQRENDLEHNIDESMKDLLDFFLKKMMLRATFL